MSGRNENHVNDRRDFVRTGAILLAGSALLPATTAAAAQKQSMEMGAGHAESDGYVMDVTTTGHCATCEFWGGPRRIAADRKTVITTGLGWCNNPSSPNFQKQTTPDHGPISMWKKWQALG